MNEADDATHAGRETRWREGTVAPRGTVLDDRDPSQRRAFRHASFFTGAGGTDIGLERAGWQTVSVSEIDPYASAILSTRWPGVPNLGDITRIPPNRVPDADLWTGGFPCQDLSIAGRMAGIDGHRSGLAFAFLDLVAARRPEAFILENVEGLKSSNGGRDLLRLTEAVAKLRYGWAYRTLDGQHFDVPQRRRRLFILAIDLERHPDWRSAGTVLAIGSQCGRDHQSELQTRAQAAARDGRSPQVGGIGSNANHTVYAHTQAADPNRSREAYGVARRVDDRAGLVFTKARRTQGGDTPETWDERGVTPTINGFEYSDIRTTTVPVGGFRVLSETAADPAGYDSNRYRACGNGIVAGCAEWLGERLALYLGG